MGNDKEAFDLVKYAETVKDPSLQTYEELKTELFDQGKIEEWKRQLLENYDKQKTNLVILGTGGTFQSAHTDAGLAPYGSLEESFNAMNLPYNVNDTSINLFEIFNYDSALLETGEHIRFLAEIIIDLLNDCLDSIDGFIVTHGTDTMTETANYLSLILGRGLKKPIILTGSQDPARVKNSDAIYHMDNCLKVHDYIKPCGVAEVMVLCGNELVRGAWVKKKSDKNSDAFASYNNKPLLEVANKLIKAWRLSSDILRADANTPFLPFNGVSSSSNITCEKLADISNAKLAETTRGNRMTILTLLGSATCPNTHADIIKTASEHGKIVVLQSPFHDSVLNTGTYTAGSTLAKSNIPQLKGTESFIKAKLNWLWHYLEIKSKFKEGLGETVDIKQQQQLYAQLCQNVVGEWF